MAIRAKQEKGHGQIDLGWISALGRRLNSERLIWKKVSAAHQFSYVLHSADKRDEIKRCVQRAAERTFSPDGVADGEERDGAAQPGQ
jgi:hypothetical protein